MMIIMELLVIRSQWAEIRIYDLRFGITSSRLIFNIRTYMRPRWGRDSIYAQLWCRMKNYQIDAKMG